MARNSDSDIDGMYWTTPARRLDAAETVAEGEGWRILVAEAKAEGRMEVVLDLGKAGFSTLAAFETCEDSRMAARVAGLVAGEALRVRG